jgi:superfamily II DNA or RNA helicase
MHLDAAIYIRRNEWHQGLGLVKIGIASCIKDRNSTYITGEPIAGEYLQVIEVSKNDIYSIDKKIKNEFKGYNRYHPGGGTEFYEKAVINLLLPYIQALGIPYKVLSKEEIKIFQRKQRYKEIKLKVVEDRLLARNHLKKEYFSKMFVRNTIPTPKYYQQEALDKAIVHYKTNHIGKLLWTCGMGKTLFSVFLAKALNCGTVLFGVYSKLLQKQVEDEIKKVYPDASIIFVGGHNSIADYEIVRKEIILNKGNYTFVIAMYHSCDKLLNLKHTFDLKIGDEAHHLVGLDDNSKGFRAFHNIKSDKTLFMTATEKTIKNKQSNELSIYSMDDEETFGKCIDCKSTYWAIQNKLITDYKVVVLKNAEETPWKILKKVGIVVHNMELFMSAFMTLKSMQTYCDKLTHIMIYTNNTENAELVKTYVDAILDANILQIKKEDVYNRAIHSKDADAVNHLKSILDTFARKPYGIISCVYMMGEGFDFPKLNGVCVAENMKSLIRITQSLLRCNRLNHSAPLKKGYYLLPYIDNGKWNDPDNSFCKVREIIKKLANDDESLEHKLVLLECKETEEKEDVRIKEYFYEEYHLEENKEELDKLVIKLKYNKSLTSDFSEEEDEYRYIRMINQELKLKSKIEYLQSAARHSDYIPDPYTHFTTKGVWRNWTDFLGIDTSGFLKTKEEWVLFCKEKNIRSLEDYDRCCSVFAELPRDPVDFYPEFTNIPYELGLTQTRRR